MIKTAALTTWSYTIVPKFMGVNMTIFAHNKMHLQFHSFNYSVIVGASIYAWFRVFPYVLMMEVHVPSIVYTREEVYVKFHFA